MTEFDALAKKEGFKPGLAGRWRPGLRESALFDRNGNAGTTASFHSGSSEALVRTLVARTQCVAFSH